MPGGGRYLTLDRLLQIKALMQSLVISEYSVHSKCIFLKRKGKRRILYKNDILQTGKNMLMGSTVVLLGVEMNSSEFS